MNTDRTCNPVKPVKGNIFSTIPGQLAFLLGVCFKFKHGGRKTNKLCSGNILLKKEVNSTNY